MANKDYLNQPKKDLHATRERDKIKKDKLLQDELESNRRAIATYYAGSNPND